MNFTEPWYAESNTIFVNELRNEITSGHALCDFNISVLARRHDRDDVLFALNDGSNRVAVVHLTWKNEQNPAWPKAMLFESLEAWLNQGSD